MNVYDHHSVYSRCMYIVMKVISMEFPMGHTDNQLMLRSFFFNGIKLPFDEKF